MSLSNPLSRKDPLYHITVGGLSVALALVEGSSFYKMVEVRHWTDKTGTMMSDLTSLAIIGLMIAAILAMANPNLDDRMRLHIRIAGTGLCFYQACTNIIISYNHAKYLEQMPPSILTDFTLGLISPEIAVIIVAILNGGVLSFAAIIFWQVLAHIVLTHTEEVRREYNRERHLEYAEELAEKRNRQSGR
jgi:hypothetical protein